MGKYLVALLDDSWAEKLDTEMVVLSAALKEFLSVVAMADKLAS